MIELLHINEYVYLKDVDIYFSSGLNVITGETGTGKSLLLDVIGAFLIIRISEVTHSVPIW